MNLTTTITSLAFQVSQIGLTIVLAQLTSVLRVKLWKVVQKEKYAL